MPIEGDIENVHYNERYLVAGWGKTDSGIRSDELLKANIPAQKIDACEEAFNITLNNDLIVCAGGENLIDTCNGDSGGPLFWTGKMKNSGARYFQYGVTAIGYRYCGQLLNGSTPPAAYTNSSSFVTWIKSNMF